MAQIVAVAILSVSIFADSVFQAVAADFVRVSADIVNLRYAAIDPTGQAGLSRGYAIDIAAALSTPVTDVRSLDGSFASVTVSTGVSLLPTSSPAGGGSTHNDLRPDTTTPPTAQRTTLRSTTTLAPPAVTTQAPVTSPATTTTKSPAQAVTTTAPATTTTIPATATTAIATTTRAPRVWTTRQPLPQNTSAEMPPMWPMRGIAYGALPCKGQRCQERGLPSQDMLQIGYAQQWGSVGRDDLGLMKAMGGNGVRMYHSFGLNTRHDHSGFLDHASQLGVNVMPGFHTELTWDCPDFDCFRAWKEATLKGFQLGYQQGDGWHPAVAMVILLNEPDFLEFNPQCQQHSKGPGAWCRTKAGISALDGLLAAEKEAGVAPGRVNLTIAWSFGMSTSIDGKVTGPGYFGFQDILAAVADPSLVDYTPRTSQAELAEAYRTRWVNCLNTQAPWSYVEQVIGNNYAPFKPTPWFIGEYGANGQPRSVIESDLRAMQGAAAQSGYFMGVTFFQFQTANQKGGSELNFGMFDIGTTQIGETGEVCDDGLTCLRWPVYCLSLELDFLPGTLKLRAEAVASAWNGTLAHRSLCGNRRLSSTPFSRLGFYVRVPAGMTAASVSRALTAPSMRQQLVRRTAFELGASSAAIVGTLNIGGMAFQEERGESIPNGNGNEASNSQPAPVARGLPWWGWLTVAIIAALLAVSTAAVACCVVRGKTIRQQSMGSNV